MGFLAAENENRQPEDIPQADFGRVPERFLLSEIANHIERRGKPVKADRGVGKNISAYIHQQTGTLIPLGSGICRECRSFFKTADKDKVDSLSSGVQRILLEPDSDPLLICTPAKQEVSYAPETPRSLYQPSESSSDSDETVRGTRSSRDKLNKFLASRDISPVRSQLEMPWDMASDRTQ
ncbi:uncharacterized protein [Pocillopora verrucosa]|uniref:uncharacterized protein n=1 Tax=Pocillopora verrucosa TaxID=203993 RepID=UPI0033400D11